MFYDTLNKLGVSLESKQCSTVRNDEGREAMNLLFCFVGEIH